jgi:hypothetical protein
MKNQNQKNPGKNNPDVNTGKSTGTEKNPDVNKNAETKTKGEEVWKNPDPTIPERKNDPDPTKPEKQEGPFSKDTDKRNPNPAKKNPARTESNNDEEIGSLEEQDIDDQGITGEAKDDDDFEADADRRKAS